MDYQAQAIFKSVEVVFQMTQKWMPLIFSFLLKQNKPWYLNYTDCIHTATESSRTWKEPPRYGKHTSKLIEGLGIRVVNKSPRKSSKLCFNTIQNTFTPVTIPRNCDVHVLTLKTEQENFPPELEREGESQAEAEGSSYIWW